MTTNIVAGVVAVLACLVASYVRSWYRLRHFPGPILASVSYLWMAKAGLSGRAWKIYMETKDKYQSTLIRIGPDVLMTDDPAIVRHMNGARSPYKRDTWYNSFKVDPRFHHMFSTVDDVLHSQLKSKTAAAYTGKDLPTFEVDIDNQLEAFKHLIRTKYLSTPGDTRPMDFGKTAQHFALDSITKLAFGHEWGFIAADADVRDFIQTVEDAAPIIAICCDIPPLRRILLNDLVLLIAGPKDTDKKGYGHMNGIAKSVITERYESGELDKPDMLGSFIRHGLSREQCAAEVPLAVFASSDTSAGVIRGTMLYLATAPLIYQRLQAEIDDAVACGKATRPIISVTEAKALPYLQAVIWEGMRIHPPNHILASKVVPPGGDVLDGKFVPGGTKIGWNVWSLLRRSDMFGHDADVFRPERWLEVSEAKRIEMERHVDLIFGYGRYMCVGKTIAMVELNKVFFELLRDFDFQIIYPKTPWTERQYSVFFIRNMWVKVTPRADI